LKKNRQYQVANTAQYNPVQKRRYPPQKHKQQTQGPVINGNFFQGNLAQNMKFGGKDHDLSGYVVRTVVMKDKFGNLQIAKEKQFFNSSKHGMRVRVNDDNEKD